MISEESLRMASTPSDFVDVNLFSLMSHPKHIQKVDKTADLEWLANSLLN